MHEASISEAVVKMATAEARSRSEADGKQYRITRIGLVVGEATGYMRESLEFYVAASARGSEAEGARLEIRYVRPLLKCPSCGLEFERRRFSFDCPSCGATGTMTRVGSEFFVDSIELSPACEGGAAAGRNIA
jgi:hydrogenase nickel incorporation protein HypA/HybF